MKFIISNDELYNNLQLVNKVIPSRPTYPALSNFLFELQDEKLKVTATDLETTLIAHLPVQVAEGEGKVTVEAKKLMDILKEFPEQPLTFEINDETFEITIYTEFGKYQLPGYDAEDYPTVVEINEQEAVNFKVNSDVLNRGINKTFFAIADDELRPQINGILIQLKPDSLTFVATDAHKLVRFKRLDYSFDVESNVILPKKPADLLKNLTAKLDTEIDVSFDSKNIVFRMDNFVLIGRLIEGEYPEYEAIIPQGHDKKLVIDRELFLSTIKRVSIFANETSKLVKFHFVDNTVEISAQDIDFSTSAFEKLECTYEGEEFQIGFKSVFMIESLQNFDSTDIIMTMDMPEKAVLIYPAISEDNEDEMVLVMPMAIE